MVSAGTTNNPHYYGRRRPLVSLVTVRLGSLLHLRRPIQILAQKVPSPVLLCLAVQCVWIIFDRYVTSQQTFATPRPYIPPTESSPVSPFYGPPYDDYNGPTRVFPSRSSSFPCASLASEAEFSNPGPALLKSGFLLLMQPQVASTTLASVASRIARNVAHREHAASITPKNQTACATWTAQIKAKRFKHRIMDQSFLWTVVREPVDRLVSKFFHTVKEGGTTTLERFKEFLQHNANQECGSYMKTMTMRRYIHPQRTDLFPTYMSEILAAYDFIGVQERWDESLAVLQLLLGLETQDMLYLKTKSSSSALGGASFALVDKTCVQIQPQQITLKWKEYFHQPFMFEEIFEPDVFVYKGINASLDATIASLGRDRVDQTVKRLQWAQREVEARCTSTVYPCSAEGKLQATTDCFVADVGCGSQCLDSVGKELSTNPTFLQLE